MHLQSVVVRSSYCFFSSFLSFPFFFW